MKQWRLWTKKSIALALAICMVFGAVGYIASSKEVKAAASPSEVGYRQITIGDFAGTESLKATGAGLDKTYMYGSLNGTYLDTIVDFNGAGSIDYMAASGGWGGIRLEIRDGDLYIHPGTVNRDGVLQGFENAYGLNPYNSLYIKATDIGIASFDEPFRLQLGVQYASISSDGTVTDLTIQAWAGEAAILYGNRYEPSKWGQFVWCGDSIGVHPGEGKTIELTTPKGINVAENNTVITPEDVGIAYGTYNQHDVSIIGEYLPGTESGLGMDGTTFHTKAIFEGPEAYLHIGGWDDGKSGIRLASTSNGPDQLLMFDTYLDWQYRTDVFKPEGLPSESAVANAEVDIKISYNYVDKHGDGLYNDLQLGVWFNDELYNNSYIIYPNYTDEAWDNAWASHVTVYTVNTPAGNSSLTLISPEEQNFTEMTFWDYQREDYDASGFVADETTNPDLTNLDMKIFKGKAKFTTVNASVRLGGWAEGDNKWMGLQFGLNASGSQFQVIDNFWPVTGVQTGDENKATAIYTDGTNLAGKWIEFSARFRVLGTNLFATYTVGDQCKTICYIGAASYAGNYMVLHNEGGEFGYKSVGGRKIERKDPVTYNLSGRDGYLINGKNVTVNGAATANGTVLKRAGDYIIEQDADTKRTRKVVSLYRVGDIHFDTDLTHDIAGSPADYTYLQEYINGDRVLSRAQLKGADLNNDEKVDEEDLSIMSWIRAGGEAAAEGRLNDIIYMYYPPSLSYDFIGGDEVMPIFGFFGPTPAGTGGNPNNLLTDKVYGYIKEAGVNMITYTPIDAYHNEANGFKDIKKMLEFGEKYNIGYYISDIRLNSAIQPVDYWTNKEVENATPLTASEIADRLSDYSQYESMLGTEVKDEPTDNYMYNGSTYPYFNQTTFQQNIESGNWPKVNLITYYKDAAHNLSKYVNTNGYINHMPSFAPFFSNYYYTISNFEHTSYQEYFDRYLNTDGTRAQVLCIDHYVFQDYADHDSINHVEKFFKSMLIQRQKSIQYNVPMWNFMAAGSDYHLGEIEASKYPSEEENWWNANILLAFGSKGIGYFPLVQNLEHADDNNDKQVTGSELEGTGFINFNGEKAAPYYDQLKNINTHIQAVDDVLMKSRSKGLVLTAGYAWDKIYNVDKQFTTGAVIGPERTAHLKSVTSNNTTYGAVVGCFDYKGTEAFYVVNYDVRPGQSQKVTLTFDNTYNVKYVQNAVTSTAKTNVSTLDIPSGQAVLVVLESVAQPEAWETAGDWGSYEISHSDFFDNGNYIADQKYAGNGIVAKGSFTPFAANSQGQRPATVDGTVLNTDVVFDGDVQIRYGGSLYDGSWGFAVCPSSDGKIMEVSWQGNNADPQKRTFAAASVGLTSFQNTKMNIKISVEKANLDGGGSEDDLRIGLYINGKMATDGYIDFLGYAGFLGNYMGVFAVSEGASVTFSSPMPTAADHDMITTSDIGIGDAYTMPESVGTYSQPTMDGTAFSATIDFKHDENNTIRFAGYSYADGGNPWVALTLHESAPGTMMIDTHSLANFDTIYNHRYAYGIDWGFSIPEDGEFDLCITTDFVDFDRDGYKDDVKLRIFVDGKAVHGHFFLQDAAKFFGNDVLFYSAPLGASYGIARYADFTVKAAPYVENLGEIAIDLDKTGSYTVPGTDVTYDKTGQYQVSYKDGTTTRTSEVILYRDGDINVDNKVDAKDLIRAKKAVTTPVTLSDATINGFAQGYIPAAFDARGRFNNISSIMNNTVELAITFPESPNASVRLGGPINSWFGLVMCYDNTTGKARAEYWVEGGTIGQILESANFENVSIKANEEHVYRIETSANGEDAIFTIYVDGTFAAQMVAEGRASEITNGIFAYTTEELPLKIMPVHTAKAVAESSDIDNDGSIENTYEQLQDKLLGLEIEKEVRFGVLGDVHITADSKDNDRQIRLKKALNYYRAMGAETIIVNGDIAEIGTEDAYDVLLNTVNDVYGDVPKAAWPEFVFTADAHDYYEAWTWTGGTGDWNSMKTRFASKLGALSSDLNGTNTNTSVEVGGYTFIGMSADSSNSAGYAVYNTETLEWLRTELAAAAEKDPTKPIFVAIHQPPQNTIAASDGANGVTTYKNILAQYPQVVLFSSHTQAALEDEHSIYQGDYTVVNTGSILGVGGFGRDGQGSNITFDNDAADASKTGQALLVKVKGAKVDIQRYNVATSTQIKNNWVIQDATDKASFKYTLNRFANMTEKPVFASDATGSATWSGDVCTVKFKAATHSDFVYYYEITAGNKTYRLLTNFYKGINKMSGTCKFQLTGIPKLSEITVRAVDAYGNKSEAFTIN